MKAIVGTAAVAALATFTLMGARGADAPSRPPGVSAAEWAPISDTMGVVLVDQLLAAGDAPILTQDAPILTQDAPVLTQDAPSRPNRSIRGGPVAAGIGAALISPITGYLMVRRGNIWQRLIVIEPVKGPGVAG